MKTQKDDYRNKLKEQLVCTCDLLNTWAREIGVEECFDPCNNLNLRNLVDRIWMKKNNH